MGRWAQSQRRGSIGNGASTQSPATIDYVSETGGNSVILQFNREVDADGLYHVAANFLANGKTVVGNVINVSPSEVQVPLTGSAPAGAGWSLVGTMPGVIDKVVSPAGGTIIS